MVCLESIGYKHLILFALSLIVLSGIRRGLYRISGWMFGYLPEILAETPTRKTLSDTSKKFQLFVGVLDVVISWLSIFILNSAYVLLAVGLQNSYLTGLSQILLVYHAIIGLWRMCIRYYIYLKHSHINTPSELSLVDRLRMFHLSVVNGSLIYYLFIFIFYSIVFYFLHIMYIHISSVVISYILYFFMYQLLSIFPVVILFIMYCVYDWFYDYILYDI